MPAEGFLRHRGLIALAVGGAVGQACLLTLLSPAARPLAPQVTALPPLAVFHDLRWLFGYNRSGAGLALAFAGLVLARAVVSTALIRLAWPRRLPRPGWEATFGRCVIFTVTASILLSPVVTLLFGVSLLPFSWPYLAALPAMLLILIPLSHGGLLGSWWRILPPARAMGWLLASFIVLSTAAVAIARLPAPAAVAVAGLAGVVNARGWYGLAAAVTRQEAPRPVPPGPAWLHAWEGVLGRPWARGWPAPVSPVVAATALALIVVVTRLVFVMAGHTPEPGAARAMAPRAAAVADPAPPAGPAMGTVSSAVLVIGGFGSSCCAPSAAMPLPALGDLIAAQVWWLHDRTREPVSIVAESEGTLGVYAMLARHPDVPVGSVVLLSPIVDPGQAGRAPSASHAANPVSGGALSALVRVAGALSPYGESGAERLIGSVGSDGAAFAAEAARHGRRLRWLAVIPLADAVTLPVCDLPSNVIVVPAMHDGLFGDPRVEGMIERFLSDRRVAGPEDMRDAAEVIAAAAAAWRMPVIGPAPPTCPR